MKYQWFIFVIILLCGGCGYHLRGSTSDVSLGYTKIYVSSADAAAANSELKRQLLQSGISVVSDKKEAEAVVSLRNEQYDRRVLSVDPDNGKVLEYELGYLLHVSAVHADGKPLLESQKVTILRDITFDRDQVLGKEDEERAVRMDMARDAAQAILFRLQAVEPPQ